MERAPIGASRSPGARPHQRVLTEAHGPNRPPEKFQFLCLQSFMNTTYGFQIWLPKIVVNKTKSDQMINDIQVTK